uniref:Uncharacterized protein n=1 Tax=Panagrolaimus sp. PS1159 TaxID=55785 RepID=A0AC35FBP8_9BILA
MGINMIPINIIAKGKDCYYYNVKIHSAHAKACTNPTYQFQPFMTIVGCPENNEFDLKEINRMNKIINACPTMKPNETQWKYETHIIFTTNFCGQFLRGLKLENGKYVPKEIELRTITMEDFEMTGMSNVSIYHGCGFNPAQNLTLCTCFAAFGECDNLYHVGKVHLLRYLPFKD